MDHMKLSHRYLATAKNIPAHPVSHDIAWHDVASMIAQLDGTEGPLNSGVHSFDEQGWGLDGSGPPSDEGSAES